MEFALSHVAHASVHGRSDLLDLAWTSDERQFLDDNVEDVVRAVLTDELRTLSANREYLVADPYGTEALRSAVAGHLGLDEQDFDLVCGAGVGGLLHDLAALTAGKDVVLLSGVYPNFPYWARQSGARLRPFDPVVRGDVYFLERPAMVGDDWADLSSVDEICSVARAHGAIVIIDESNANYCPPAHSAAQLVAPSRPLIVLRGLSKAYGLGGLRAGWAMFPMELGQRVRQVVTPLAITSLTLRMCTAVLELGDVATSLRSLIDQRVDWTLQMLEGASLDSFIPASRHLPYVLSPASDAAARLEAIGILAKSHTVVSADNAVEWMRMSVPLDRERVAAFTAAITP